MASEVYQISDHENNEASDTDNAGTEDYTPTASDLETEQCLDSSYLSDDEIQLSQSIPWHSLPKKHSSHQHRSIIASSSLSKFQGTIYDGPSESSSFTFLNQECYACTCQLPGDTGRCKVLGYFQMKFFQAWQAIFCPIHNCLVPASQLAHHLYDAHTEWTSPRKKEESKDMAKHITSILGLLPTQSADEIMALLPSELNEPLVDDYIHQSFKCSLCKPISWHVKNTSGGASDRYLRKHMKGHEKVSDIKTGDWQWTYRVSIYPQAGNHFFVLPKGGTLESLKDSAVINQPVPVSDFPGLSISSAQSSIAFATTQDWPLHLKWESYAAEIQAGNYVEQLRTLIRPPKVRKAGSSTNFLENGLLYVRQFSIRYMKDSGLIFTTSIKHLGKVMVSEKSKRPFHVVGDTTVIKYSQFLLITVAMLLRHIDAILREKTSAYGPFKLRGTRPQFKAALRLYKIFLTNGGAGLDSQADWAIHHLFETLVCATGSNNRAIHYPTDQAIFLWAFLSAQTYRIPSHVQSLLSAGKYCFRCIALQIARIQVLGEMDGLFFEDQVASAFPTSGTEYETDGSGVYDGNTSLCEEGQTLEMASTSIDKNEFLRRLDMHLSGQNNYEAFDTSPTSLHTEGEEPKTNLYDAVKCFCKQWLVWSTDIKHSGTPFGHIHHVIHFVTRASYSLGTVTCFDCTLDGQTLMYSPDDGIHWHAVDFSQWPALVNTLIDTLKDKISMQLPECQTFLDLLTHPVIDDLSHAPPHKQIQNSSWMDHNAQQFKHHMLSSNEQRHFLTSQGKLQKEKLQVYLQHDQEIRGLIAALVATTTSVCLRSFQFKSILIGSDANKQRNVWLLNNRFILGKPAAKQHSISFADTLYWLPSKITDALLVFFYFQQPFIDDILGVDNHQYAIHLWPLWPARSNAKSDALSVWSGSDINEAVQKYTKMILDVPLDCQSIRQLGEGLLHQKFPLLFEPFHISPHLPTGTYHIDHILQQYAKTLGLERLVDPIMMRKDKIAAVLLVSDIWQALIKVEPKSETWLPISTDTFIFPATLHKDLAYTEAQQLKEIALSSKLINAQSLTEGLKLLENSDFFSFDYHGDSENYLECAQIFMHVTRCLLFGTGGPRYSQRPPVGGIHFQDLVEAGAMVSKFFIN
ncbi:hypothetical protein V8E53_000019 [Lactarius tabidus]